MRFIQAQWLFSSLHCPPPSASTSASHTAYSATFGTSFSLLGFSHLGHWHKINEDTKKTQGSELEGVGGWGVKLLGCKIALAAVLLFQHFMVSCCVPTCLFSAFFRPPFFFPFVFLSTPYFSWAPPHTHTRLCRNVTLHHTAITTQPV